MRLLIVEDEEDMQEALCYGLRKRGYAVDAAGNGTDAVQLCQINEYDLVVLDLNLPGLDGMEVLQQIQSLGKPAKVLILSARSELEDKVAGLDGGASDCLTKPFHFEELEARIRMLLRRSFIQEEASLKRGGLCLDTNLKTVRFNEHPLDFSMREFAILEYLMRISGNDLSHRVEIRDRQDEIGRLARSFNLMMDKVSASFERQKRFSASAAHELKTPLATIAVNLDVLALEEAPPAARLEKVLKVIRTNNERMIRLVDDLFRLTSENGSIVNEEVSLEELLAESAEELSRPIQEKHLTVSIGSMPGLKLTGSRVMLSRAVGNLFENAVKYNRDYGTISISARKEAGKIIMRMADTGIGIPKEEISRIFEPFYRVDKSRSRAMGGSGLGLPLVKDILEKHGGNITVKSTPGESTVFILEFPENNFQEYVVDTE